MKLSLAVVVLLGVSDPVGAGKPSSGCGDNTAETSTFQTLTYDGYTVRGYADTGAHSAFPTNDLLNIRANPDCATAIDFQVLQNLKTVNGGIITTGNTISHVNVAWGQCDGSMCDGSETQGCQKFGSDVMSNTAGGPVLPGTNQNYIEGDWQTAPSDDGWYTACCDPSTGRATITVQYVDGQFQTDRPELNGGQFSVCNDKLECIPGGNNNREKNGDYKFEVVCNSNSGPDPTPGPTPSPTVAAYDDDQDDTPGPTDCPAMDNNGDSRCPSSTESIVQILDSDGNVIGPDSEHVIWDITFVSDDEISFKVDSPYGDAHIFVDYHKKRGDKGAFDAACDGELNVPDCNTNNADLLSAYCYHGIEKYTRVGVYFVSGDPLLAETSSADLPCCAEKELPFPDGWKVREVVFKILCGCPDDA